MRSSVIQRAARAATIGLAGMAAYQVMLAAGAPFGEAAWGGAHQGRLPPGLRIGSGVSVLIYALAVAFIRQRAGLPPRWVPDAVARIGSWTLVALMGLGAVTNFLSSSPWERFLLGPIALLIAASCLIVARGAQGSPEPGTDRPRRRDRAVAPR